ncbi:MAG: hypothetical protein Q9183_000599 [Haloplaca sp. 2 TL-2023]
MGMHKRGPWSQQEDTYLLQLVSSQGAHNWVRISQLIESRSPKQCRERFHQNLKPSLNHDPITPQEGEIIEQLVGEMGKRWAEIARRLHGRSDNAVKNWWNGGMNRRRRINVRRSQDHVPSGLDQRIEPHLSFARPVAGLGPPFARPIQVPSVHQRIEHPMISPAASDGSAVDSQAEAPSLVSDSTSVNSPSPNGLRQAHPHLPPPVTPGSDSWQLWQQQHQQYHPPHRHDGAGPMFETQHATNNFFESHRPLSSHYHQRLYQFAEVATNASPVNVPRASSESPPQRHYQLPSFNTFVRGAEKPESPIQRAKMSVSGMLD